MFSLSSWLSLPSILPTNIQSRFISYFLKRSLGHLVKPGQLDSRQIEAQIGSGFVHINDVELDEHAFNEYLLGSPLMFQSGSIGQISIRLPWANFLSDPIEFSASSLSLTFICSSNQAWNVNVPKADHLSESVGNLAQTFLYDELSPNENYELQKTLHPSRMSTQLPPGSFDPFMSAKEIELNTDSDSRDFEDHGGDSDASVKGVSLIAALIERLLSKVKFNASAITIRIILPGEVELTARLGDINYTTENTEKDPGKSDGEVRVLSFNHISMHMKDFSFFRATRAQSTWSPEVPSESSSEDDDNPPNFMLQSIVSLPPRRIPSQSSSPESSMYHSATSSIRTENPDPSDALIIPEEETILSFSETSKAVNFRIITPRIASANEEQEMTKNDSSRTNIDKIKVTLDVSSIGIALEPRQVRNLVLLSAALSARNSVKDNTHSPDPMPLSITVDFTASFKAITVLALRPTQSSTALIPITRLNGFFSHPASMTCLPLSNVRIHLENIQVTSPFVLGSSHMSKLNPASERMVPAQTIHAQIHDFSIFVFTETTDGNTLACPFMISDQNLLAQYDQNVEYPSFDVLDWTSRSELNRTLGITRWRVRAVPLHRKANETTPSHTSPPSPCIDACMSFGSSSCKDACTIDIIPLHVFFDTDIIERVIEFVKAIKYDQLSRSPILTPVGNETPKEKGSLHGFQGDGLWRKPGSLLSDVPDERSSDFNFSVNVSFVRLEIRVPSLSNMPTRSGAVVLDFCGIQLGHQTENTAISFDGTSETAAVIGVLEINALKAAVALPGDHKAKGFLSIRNNPQSSKPSFGFTRNNEEVSNFDRFFICLRQSSSNDSSFSCEIHLPTVTNLLSKQVLDSVTYWADDISKRLFTTDRSTSESRIPSLIGSKYFTRGSAVTGSSEIAEEGAKSGYVVKISVGRANIRLLVPREDSSGLARPMDVTVVDANILAEIKPESKNETILTVGIMDLSLSDTLLAGDLQIVLQLTVPYEELKSFTSLLKLSFVSAIDDGAGTKNSKIKLSLSSFTYFLGPNVSWITDLASFAKTPDGTFDTVVPNERTKLSANIRDACIHVTGRTQPAALVFHLGDLAFDTVITGQSTEIDFTLAMSDIQTLFIDDRKASTITEQTQLHGMQYWKRCGYALLAELEDARMNFHHQYEPIATTTLQIVDIRLSLHACADTLPALSVFANDLSFFWSDEDTSHLEKTVPMPLNQVQRSKENLFASVEEQAFIRPAHLGSAPDMIYDDLPRNLDYLDNSFHLSDGLKEQGDTLDINSEEVQVLRDAIPTSSVTDGIISNIGGETIRMLDDRGINVIEGHFENVHPESGDKFGRFTDVKLSVQVENCDVSFSLYEGYDWIATRRVIEQEIKAIKKRLVKIRQLLATGQVPDDSIEHTSAILFNSVSIGLTEDLEDMDRDALIAAIDEELGNDTASEVASQSSWQSFKRSSQVRQQRDLRSRNLERSRNRQIEFSILGVRAEVDIFHPNNHMASRILLTVNDLEILDHMKTSTWKKFLTSLRTDFQGNVRETDSDMVRVELCVVHSVPGLSNEEGRLRAKFLPIKLHVDQDALDFMKKFFNFQRPDKVVVSESTTKDQFYFQHVEIFPVDLKLDYKPKRVDYRALREGKTIELMNFFHFDGAEITLRHITLSGITGWPRLFDTLNDLWTPDVKANQLADIISGVSPVRSLVNVGSGVADLVLLPIAQYKKDKRVVRGLQKGTTSLIKTTAMEAVKLGARLATGTQIILEQAESVLGGQGQFRDAITAEALNSPILESYNEEQETELISKFADQPQDVREGLQFAYRSLSRNLTSAAQTILAVPMEVYERSGNEGSMRAVVRAVPIAVLKPMIGATEAVSKTLIGLRNTMDPEVKHETQAKYKQR